MSDAGYGVAPSRVFGFENEIFGSRTSSLDVVFPALPEFWQPATDVISIAKINRIAHRTCIFVRMNR